MKRISLYIISLLITLSILPVSGAAAANPNNFTITHYDIAFSLTRDADKRSVLTTKETIVADFPSTNQNHGIERAIPKKYDSHSTSLNITSVKDATGHTLPHKTYDQGQYTVLRIGDADTYVHGQQQYVIEYTQRDVTKVFDDTHKAEFYWDTNGTEWRVPIQELSVSLTIDASVRHDLTGDMMCYQGKFGAIDRCVMTHENGTYTTRVDNLKAGENVTVAVGFAPEAFAPYQASIFEVLLGAWLVLQGILIAVSVGVLVWVSVRYSRWSKRMADVGTIITEYVPPKDASVTLSAALLPYARSVFTAQLLDFAVRHYIKIYETKEKSFWSSSEYELEIIKPIDDLRAEEKEFLTDLFKDSVAVGTKLLTKDMRKDYSLSTRMMDNPKKLQSLMRGEYGLEHKVPEKSMWFTRVARVLLVFGIILLSPPLLLMAGVAALLGHTLWVRTDAAVALYRYVMGLKLYISVAEEERLKLLQSPEGAEKVHVSDATEPKQLVKLYEKVLPYAVLFGQEKQWNRQLGMYYESANTQPDWYTGAHMAAFNAAAFSSAMSGLTTSINSTGAASSSTGGSSGGGSSGGGGGGGGGGGW